MEAEDEAERLKIEEEKNKISVKLSSLENTENTENIENLEILEKGVDGEIEAVEVKMEVTEEEAVELSESIGVKEELIVET